MWSTHIRYLAGKLTQGWSDFELKDGKLTRIMGIIGLRPGSVAPDLASSIDTL
ncbi:hypothetical protein [Dictyobacter formicarum]|uniref:hypothetical protein n=1 Tax=Dictyobacter formicarum TaxID=2778368 RepID=UPI0019159EC1|nr:hypothetical protein [Dictyobacter formicarum]